MFFYLTLALLLGVLLGLLIAFVLFNVITYWKHI